MFYEYHQNNSGGAFDEDAERGIGHFVIIEADSASEADERAERIGLYFDDYDEDGNFSRDCECCGARWSPAWGEGSEVPEVYARKIKNGKIAPSDYSDWKWMEGPEGFIHYRDGRVEAFDY